MTKEIEEIRQSNVIIRDRKAIAEVLFEHYKKIFGTKIASTDKDYLKELVTLIPQLDKDHTKGLEEPISLAEVENAVDNNNINNNNFISIK